MLAALALLTAGPSTGAADEIVVIGRQLDAWRGKLASKSGVLGCRTTKSTGDKAVDAIGCQTLIQCLGPRQADMNAVANAKLPRREKNSRLSAMGNAAIPCFEETRRGAIAALAVQRRAR